MSVSTVDATDGVWDVVGVGFGPSNLALAVALAEHPEPPAAVFLERQPRFGWHRGMLLDDATMQVSFLKDLVTLRNPTSRFSYLAYLHDRGRLIDFINQKNLFPLRAEFHDYLEWTAAQVLSVHYGHEVVDISPVFTDGIAAHFVVVAQGPRTARVFLARNVVIATGLRPATPPGTVPSDRIWHSADLLTHVDALTDTPKRFIVVGAGQSAAEATAFLHTRFPTADVDAVISRYGYSPADDSPFANRIFDPAAVGEFHAAPIDVKQLMLGYHGNTNYSVVDNDLITELYRRMYQEKVLGTERLRLYNMTRLHSAETTVDGVRAEIEHLTTGQRTTLDADVLVCATGYRPADPTPLLGDLAARCHRDEAGNLKVERDYRIATGPELACGIYLQGGTEHSHGISSSLLSNTAVRAGEILQSILDRRTSVRTESTVEPVHAG